MTHISYSVASFSIMRVLTRCREGALYKNIQESWQLRRCAHQMERVASNNVTNTIPSQHSGFYFIFTPDAAFGPHCSAPAPVHQLKLIWTSSGVLILRSHSAKRHSFSYSGGGLTRSSLISG
ncbi:uncharacterized protein [Physcomitrium patens]|uniref:uncharacterized protein isoform X5 n=1 Tax=Physcomitrium patens TaxID=3218 RepID=UPI000D16B27A|nr:uncharacterized protein LOC112287457 isoform X5 [Physcomitrium patens]|eukprot:XP_024386230.1 uncharacterized protein LOC112287457 isoform X5 [Physcomitrella patens]